MSPKDLLSKKIHQEWRNLGFYYEYDGKKASWRFIGSKEGLQKFCDFIDDYVTKPQNAILSEHDHMGPYKYLKIMIFKEPIISENGIWGTLSDLKRLSKIVREKLHFLSTLNKFFIDREYSDKNKSKIEFDVRKDDFDPASKDQSLKL